MARDTRLATATVNAQADALGELCDGGYVDVFDGVRPDGPDDALTTQVRGVVLGLATPAFNGALDGVISALPITPGVGENTIVPTWGRVYRSDHVTAVMDISVGPGCNMVLGIINAGQVVTCSSFTHSVAKATPGS